MTWQDRLELYTEKWSVIGLSFLIALVWCLRGDGYTQYILGKNDIIYQTLVMFATIVVALLATFKVILVTVDRHEGISLLRSNRNMFLRFVDYIFWSICANLTFSAIAFAYLVWDKKISTNWASFLFVFVASFSVLSLIRVLVLFRIIIQKGG